jgi:hypothetical protein
VLRADRDGAMALGRVKERSKGEPPGCGFVIGSAQARMYRRSVSMATSACSKNVVLVSWVQLVVGWCGVSEAEPSIEEVKASAPATRDR